jgi:hypothetical protein
LWKKVFPKAKHTQALTIQVRVEITREGTGKLIIKDDREELERIMFQNNKELYKGWKNG